MTATALRVCVGTRPVLNRLGRLLQLWCLVIGFATFSVVGNSALAHTVSEPVDGPIERLKPGEYLWAADIAPEGPVVLIISLTNQLIYVYRNGVPIGVSTISSGRPGYSTPTGTFTIVQKNRDHKSNLYHDAPMPFMQRLTWSGIAIHAGNLPGYPASHGCIRLPLKFAELLFGVTKLGITVVVTKDSLMPEVAPVAPEPPLNNEPSAPNGYHWQPDKSPSGPVSLVVSGRDKRIIVIRNGIEIGAADVTITGPVKQTEAFRLAEIVNGRTRWQKVPLPQQEASELSGLTPFERSRLQMPVQFRKNLLEILQTGATLLVTRDTLRSAGTGQITSRLLKENET